LDLSRLLGEGGGMTPFYQPNPVVILAIDPAVVSGWALRVCGVLASSGKTETPDEMNAVVKLAYRTAEKFRRPLVVVYEKWNPHGKWSHDAKMGAAKSVGKWELLVEMLPRRKPTTKTVTVLADEWRKRMYGFCRKPKGETFNWKAYAVRTAQCLDPRSPPPAEHNEAEARLISGWASFSEQVGKVLPKRVRERGV